MSSAFRWNNYSHKNLVAAFDFGTLTADKLKVKNLAKTGSIYDATINGTYTPALPLIRCKKTPCMDFDGATNYLSLANPISGIQDFSFALWYNADAVGGMFYSRADAAVPYFYLTTSGGIPQMQVYWGIAAQPINGFPLGATRFFALTHDSSNVVKFYDNGRLYAQKTLGAMGAFANCFIGQWFDGTLRFNGRMDDYIVYNVALTPDQIQSIWRSSIPR